MDHQNELNQLSKCIFEFKFPNGLVLTTHEILCSHIHYSVADILKIKNITLLVDELDMVMHEEDGFKGCNGLIKASRFYGTTAQELTNL